MNRALEGSILKLNIQRAFFLTFLSKIVGSMTNFLVTRLSYCIKVIRLRNSVTAFVFSSLQQLCLGL